MKPGDYILVHRDGVDYKCRVEQAMAEIPADLKIDGHAKIIDHNGSASEWVLQVKTNLKKQDPDTPSLSPGLHTRFGVLGNGSVVVGPDKQDPFMAKADHHVVSKRYCDLEVAKSQGLMSRALKNAIKGSNSFKALKANLLDVLSQWEESDEEL